MTQSAGGATSIRMLSATDATALRAFECRMFREPWTDVVEELIRDHLPEAIVGGYVEAAGLWADETLCGVAAWRFEGKDPLGYVCESIAVAVRTGHKRRGCARALKLFMVGQARRAGAVAVMSEVHWDNDAMLDLNRSLGANLHRRTGDDDYCLCVIPLR